MLSYLLESDGLNIFSSVVNFFKTSLPSVLTFDWLLYIVIGLFLLFSIIALGISSQSYEVKATKFVNKTNDYFIENPYITQDNLVDFNKRMKAAPNIIRYQWQQYVLNRDVAPSHYLSRDNCIAKPLKTSMYFQGISFFKNSLLILSALAFLISLPLNSNLSSADIIIGGTATSTIGGIVMVLLQSMILPVMIITLGTLFEMFLRSRLNSKTSELYQVFYDFDRNVDKATSTLPEFIDYETLFTKREIKNGIPILQEYLDKRARQEQEELKKAMEREIDHEKYDFDTTGIDGSLLLERAMKESELFIVNRKRLLAEVNQLQTEEENNRKNFDLATKEVNRKLQATKENLSRFKTQQEQSTNRIETNYIRKQQAEEVRKQQQLEKDLEEAVGKFDNAQSNIDKEVETRKAEINENKKYIEEAMTLEFKTFAEKSYKKIYDDIDSKLDAKLNEIKDDTNSKVEQIKTLTESLEDKNDIQESYKEIAEEYERLKREYSLNQDLYNTLLLKYRGVSSEDISNSKGNVTVLNSLSQDDVNKLRDAVVEELKNSLVLQTASPKKSLKAKETKQVEKVEEPKVKEVKEVEKTEETKVKEVKELEKTEEPKVDKVEKTEEPKVKEIKEDKKISKDIKSVIETEKPKKIRKRRKTVKNDNDSNEGLTLAQIAEKKEEAKNKRAAARKAKREAEDKNKANALKELQQRISEENSRVNKQQDELKKVIGNTINVINSSNPNEDNSTGDSSERIENLSDTLDDIKKEHEDMTEDDTPVISESLDTVIKNMKSNKND